MEPNQSYIPIGYQDNPPASTKQTEEIELIRTRAMKSKPPRPPPPLFNKVSPASTKQTEGTELIRTRAMKSKPPQPQQTKFKTCIGQPGDEIRDKEYNFHEYEIIPGEHPWPTAEPQPVAAEPTTTPEPQPVTTPKPQPVAVEPTTTPEPQPVVAQPTILSFPREPLSLDSLKYYLSPNQTGHSPPHPGGEGVMTVTPCSFSSRQPRHTIYRRVTSPECAPIRVPPPTATVTDKRQKLLK